MTEEPTHLWFCTPDAAFAQVIARALGQGFDTRASEEFSLAGTRGLEGWWDVVLLDLRELTGDQAVEVGLGLMDGIKQCDEPPPIAVMLNDEDPLLGRRAFENGLKDTLPGRPAV